jgi:hypothetical protein
MTEEWRVVDEGPSFAVSNLGNVRSLRTGQIIRKVRSKYGYFIISIEDSSNRLYIQTVHRLVAKAFVEGYAPDRRIVHLDGNTENNNSENLEWRDVHGYVIPGLNPTVTSGEALGMQKMTTRRPIRVIETGEIYYTQAAIANAIGCAPASLSYSMRHGNKGFHGFHFEYADGENA